MDDYNIPCVACGDEFSFSIRELGLNNLCMLCLEKALPDTKCEICGRATKLTLPLPQGKACKRCSDVALGITPEMIAEAEKRTNSVDEAVARQAAAKG